MLGEIKSVDIEFGFAGWSENERISKKDLGGGTDLDMGVYVIKCCQWIFQQAPKSITPTGTLNEEGVDIEMSAEINYGEDRVGRVKASAIAASNNTAKIVGTKGQITILNFWCPISIIDVDGTEKTRPLPKAKHNFYFPNSCGLRYEAEEVRKCIRDGKIGSDAVTHNDSLLIARIRDEIRKQIGVKFPEDS